MANLFFCGSTIPFSFMLRIFRLYLHNLRKLRIMKSMLIVYAVNLGTASYIRQDGLLRESALPGRTLFRVAFRSIPANGSFLFGFIKLSLTLHRQGIYPIIINEKPFSLCYDTCMTDVNIISQRVCKSADPKRSVTSTHFFLFTAIRS